METLRGALKLKAKAASTRHLVRYAADLSRRYNDGSVHDRRRLACCDFLQFFYETCAEHGRFIPKTRQDELKAGVRSFMSSYVGLAAEALRQELRAWKMAPKFHVLYT